LAWQCLQSDFIGIFARGTNTTNAYRAWWIYVYEPADPSTGIEVYHSQTKSIRADYQDHHISNDETAGYNPGIDSGLLQVSYSFGR